MNDLEIIFCNQYVRAEKVRYYSSIYSISLHVSGLLYKKTPSGYKKIYPPLVSFGFPGPADFEYRENRENHVISYKTSAISACLDNNKNIQLSWGNEKIIMPCTAPLNSKETLWLRNEFINIHELLDIGGSNNTLLCKCAFIKIINFLVEKHSTRENYDIADGFKLMLDNTHNFSIPLEALAKKYGYCLHHLRRLFKKKYNIPPGLYRTNKRLEYCRKALLHSNLSCKEIAMRAGFEHASHFSKLFKEHFALTPLKMRKGTTRGEKYL